MTSQKLSIAVSRIPTRLQLMFRVLQICRHTCTQVYLQYIVYMHVHITCIITSRLPLDLEVMSNKTYSLPLDLEVMSNNTYSLPLDLELIYS